MFVKTLVAALVLAGASLTFIADASAKHRSGAQPQQAPQGWFDRAPYPETENTNGA